MIENQSNIWNKINVNQTDKKIKKFYKKSIKIKQVEKENILTQENNINNNYNTFKPKEIFINKKRGRKSKNINDVIRGSGTHDRFSDDNLKRKVKTHFHNYIIAILNRNLNIRNGNDKLLKFGKMKSSITQNITVEYNLNLFNKQIKDIITDVSEKYQNQLINSEIIDYVMKKPMDNIVVINLLNMTYKDMYLNYYLKSTKKDFGNDQIDESYEAHKEKLKKFGDKYLQNYIKNAEGLIEFYHKCKKRTRKKKKSEQNNNLGISIGKKQDNEKDFTYINNRENINNNLLTFNSHIMNYIGKHLISISTQTDIKQTEDESEDESGY